MATFIGTLENIPVDYLHRVRKAFKKLADDYVVRSPSLAERQVAQTVVEGPGDGWVFVSFHGSIPSKPELACYHRFSRAFSEVFNDNPPVTYVAVIWKYDGDGADVERLSDHGHVVTISRNEFINNTEAVLRRHCRSLSDQARIWLKSRLFVESVIPTACTTLQPLRRDNRAQLQRFFLDYDQEAAAKLDLLGDDGNNPNTQPFIVRLINGVAGSGKTLVLVNRALLLCKKFPHQQVLLLIHNKPVTHEIRLRILRYYGGLPDNLTVSTFHAWALRQKRITTGRAYIPLLFSRKDLQPYWVRAEKRLRDETDLNISLEQLVDEFEFINGHLIRSCTDYMAYNRQGRGFALKSHERQILWRIYRTTMTEMADFDHGYLPSLAIKQLCLNKERHNRLLSYHHILVDEAQFFAPSWFELVKLSLLNNGQIFMCADPNQGFLKNKLSWKNAGLEVRGRTVKWVKSYRTTLPILQAADRFLRTTSDRGDTEDYLRPDFADMRPGSKPKLIVTDTPQDTVDRLVNEITACVESYGIPLNQLLIITTRGIAPWHIKDRIENRLGNACVNWYQDKLSDGARPVDGIRLTTLDSSTGLEAGVVFIAGLETVLQAGDHLDLSEEEQRTTRENAAMRIYMSMTRAGQKLVMLSQCGVPPELTPFFDVDRCGQRE